MGEAQRDRVQEEAARPQARVGPPVAGVPDDRVADGRHVHTDLVGAAALERHARAASSARRVRAPSPRTAPPPPLEHRVGGPGRLAPAVTAIFVGVRAERPIGASTTPRSSATWPMTSARYRRSMVRVASCASEGVVGLSGAGHCQQPRGALVQPVHDARAIGGTHARPRPGGPVRGTASSNPPTSVPVSCPHRGATTRPAGLSTTASISSACTTSKRTPASATTAPSRAAGRRTETWCPRAATSVPPSPARRRPGPGRLE